MFFCLEDLFFFLGERIWVVFFFEVFGGFLGGGDGEGKKGYGKKIPVGVSWWWVLWDCLGLSQWFEGWIKWVLMISWFAIQCPCHASQKNTQNVASRRKPTEPSPTQNSQKSTGDFTISVHIYYEYILHTSFLFSCCALFVINPSNAVKMGRSCWSLVSSTKATKNHLAIRTYEGESPSTKQGIFCKTWWILSCSLIGILIMSLWNNPYTRRIHGTGIYTYIFWLIFMVNVGEYTIHGSYGI